MRSSTSRLPSGPTSPEAIHLAARAAWRTRGVALLDPSKITDPWIAQAVINEAVRLYGPRQPQPKEGNPS